MLSLGLSPNDKFLASSSQDRSLILWPSKHFASKDHKSTRGNVPYDVRISSSNNLDCIRISVQIFDFYFSMELILYGVQMERL